MKRATAACSAGFVCLATARLLWQLKVDKREDCDADEDVQVLPRSKAEKAEENATENASTENASMATSMAMPLVLELTPDAVARKLLAPLVDVLRRGGGIDATPYRLRLDGKTEVTLVRVGFCAHVRASLGGMSRSEERKVLDDFVSRIRLDPQTPSGKLLISIPGGEPPASGNVAAGGGVPLLDGCTQRHIIKRVFYRHDRAQSEALHREWVQGHEQAGILGMLGLADNVPLESMRAVLGEEVAMYFAFLNFYTRALVVPAVLGLAFFFFGRSEDVRWWILLSLLVGMWASVFLGFWGQRRYGIGHAWGQSRHIPYAHHVKSIVQRIGSGGENNNSHGNGNINSRSSSFSDSDTDTDSDAAELEEAAAAAAAAAGANNARQVMTRRCGSMLLSALLLMLVVLVDYKLLDLKRTTDAWLAEPGVADELGGLWSKLYSLFPGIAKAIAIAVFNGVFTSVAEKLVGFESYADPRDSEDSKLLKLCAFNFVSNFLYLYFYAFVERDIGKLKSSLITVLVMSLAIQNFTEVVLPLLLRRFFLVSLMRKHEKRHVKDSGDTEQVLSLTFMHEDYSRDAYDGTFGDYLEMFVQFGQVTIFAAVFPLGSLLALVNNVVEQRGDFFKMCHELNPSHPKSDITHSGVKGGGGKDGHRPEGKRHHHHGSQRPSNSNDVWMMAFRIMSYIAVATNIALLGVDQDLNTPGYQGPFSYLSEKLGMDFGVEFTFAILFFVEHGLVVLKSWIRFMLPPRGGLLSKAIEQVSKKISRSARGSVRGLNVASKNAKRGSKTDAFPPKHDTVHNRASVTALIFQASARKATSTSAEKKLLEMFDKEDISTEARDQFSRVVGRFTRRLELAERMREEAIAWAAEVVPANIIAEHYDGPAMSNNKKDD
jgi:hypothetical protein